MALIKCVECGKEISDKTKKCIHCGTKVITKEQYIKKQEQKVKRKKAKTEIKTFTLTCTLTFVIVIVALVSYVALGFLFPIKSIDFTTKYESYLNYALGENWNVTAVEKTRSFKHFWLHEYKYWTITYRDNNNKYQTLEIDNSDLRNCRNEESCSDYVFGAAIAYDYRSNLNEILKKGNISDLDENINIIDLYDIDNNEFAKDTLKLIDDKNGLSFKELSLDKLDSNYYYLELGVLYESGTNINNYTISEGKKIIEKYNIKNAIISAGLIKNDFGSTNPIYCLKGGKEITCPLENDLDSMNNAMIDEGNYISVK